MTTSPNKLGSQEPGPGPGPPALAGTNEQGLTNSNSYGIIIIEIKKGVVLMTTIIIGILIGIAIWSGVFFVFCLADVFDEDWTQIILGTIWFIPFFIIKISIKWINKIRAKIFNRSHYRVVFWWLKNGKKVNGQSFYVRKEYLTGIEPDETFEIKPSDRTVRPPYKEDILSKEKFDEIFNKERA